MDATPWISAAVGLLGVVTGSLGTVFIMGKRYGAISTKLEDACEEIKDINIKVEALRRDYEEYKLTVADTVRQTGREMTDKMALIAARLVECSADIKHAVSQEQHQELIDRLSRIEGLLNGKRHP